MKLKYTFIFGLAALLMGCGEPALDSKNTDLKDLKTVDDLADFISELKPTDQYLTLGWIRANYKNIDAINHKKAAEVIDFINKDNERNTLTELKKNVDQVKQKVKSEKEDGFYGSVFKSHARNFNSLCDEEQKNEYTLKNLEKEKRLLDLFNNVSYSCKAIDNKHVALELTNNTDLPITKANLKVMGSGESRFYIGSEEQQIPGGINPKETKVLTFQNNAAKNVEEGYDCLPAYLVFLGKEGDIAINFYSELALYADPYSTDEYTQFIDDQKKELVADYKDIKDQVCDIGIKARNQTLDQVQADLDRMDQIISQALTQNQGAK